MDAVVKFAGSLFTKTALGLRDRLESSSLGTATCGDVDQKAPPVSPTEILEEKRQFLSLFRTFSDCGFLALVAEAARSAVLVEYRTLRRAMESTLPTERCSKIRQVLKQLEEDVVRPGLMLAFSDVFVDFKRISETDKQNKRIKQ